MALFLSPIKNEIWQTLSDRQKLVDTNKTGWFSKKTPWVRFTSMASVGGDSNLRKNWILYNGTQTPSNNSFYSGFDGMYNLDDKLFGNASKGQSIKNRPMPGIKDISVQNKGSMGALREAVINFTCWDRKQLDVLEKLYMTPGITCLLEWGWSMDINEKTISTNMSMLDPLTDEEVTSKISSEILKRGGHYDGLQGPIVDFSWNMNEDGGFDCTTTLTSRADMLLAINIHGSTGGIGSAQVGENTTIEEDIRAMFNNIATELEKTEALTDINGNIVGQLLNVNGDFKRRHETELTAIREKQRGNREIDNDTQGYITWDYLEKLINNTVLFKRDKDSNISPRLHTNKVFNKKQYGLINYRTSLVSSDPYICILPNAKIVKKGGFSGFPLNGKYPYNDINPEIQSDFFVEDKVRLSKFLLNIRFVYHSYVESETLNQFLIKILNEISDACGKMWDFQIMIDEEDPEVIYIVDKKSIPTKELKPFPFKLYNRNSIVRGFSLNTEIDQKLKAMMMYGSNKKSDTVDVGEDSTFGYKLYRDSVVDLANGKLEPAIQSSRDKNMPKYKKTKDYDPIEELNNAYSLLLEKRTPETVSRMKTALNNLVQEPIDGNKIASNHSHPTLPLKLSITIDGLGGIRFGNLIDIDYKPERYSNNTSFQITNVSHTISGDSWETTLDTIMRVSYPKSDVIKNDTDLFEQAQGNEYTEILAKDEYLKDVFQQGDIKTRNTNLTQDPELLPNYNFPDDSLDDLNEDTDGDGILDEFIE